MHFARFFPDGFEDETYIDWERGYKWNAHRQWEEVLDRKSFARLLEQKKSDDIAAAAVRIGLFEFLNGRGGDRTRFERWVEVVDSLPRKRTRALTWPIVTVFGFIAQPEKHIFLKPNVTRVAARGYEFEFQYRSRPNWDTYTSLLQFAEMICGDQKGLRPRDMIDLQSFMWVQGSDEYEE